MAGLFGRSSVALGTLAFSLVLWLGRENWRSMAGGIGVIGNTHSFLFTELWKMLISERMGNSGARDVVEREPSIAPLAFVCADVGAWI